MKCKAQRNAMQCRVRCGFGGGRSLSKQQLLKVIQTHNLLLPPLSFLAAAIFSIRPIIPLKGLLNKFFSSTTQSSGDHTLICYFCRCGCFAKSCAHKLAANCAQLLRFNIKCCIMFWIRFCIGHRGSDCGSGGKVLGCCVAGCSHAQTTAPGKSRSKIDRTESHHQDWRQQYLSFASSCPRMPGNGA